MSLNKYSSRLDESAAFFTSQRAQAAAQREEKPQEQPAVPAAEIPAVKAPAAEKPRRKNEPVKKEKAAAAGSLREQIAADGYARPALINAEPSYTNVPGARNNSDTYRKTCFFSPENWAYIEENAAALGFNSVNKMVNYLIDQHRDFTAYLKYGATESGKSLNEYFVEQMEERYSFLKREGK